MFEDNIVYNILLKKKVKRNELINWAENKGANFNNDSSIEAIKYFLYDFKLDLVQYFNNYITLKVETINIEEINQEFLNVIFEIEESYPMVHKPEINEIMIILVNGAEIHQLNYVGFEIAFKKVN